ncbi:hypothetical protein RHMOL_Rhmol08G0149500 [Rhododendron molle]|uniref:Uncharacterized protein n=1 Tax=Rhododendron molle TaxID=49168 RepID=A0ACC0MNS9_RHOML|nr:hypothetical protein RHMOL_Rhmol08G0149500 [Rhododendron molle]
MVRGGKEAEKNAAAAEANPEAEERKRRKRVAFSKGILSEAPAKASTAALLSPSKTVTKHHGKDILRKSQRKNRFLFSFPGLLAPLSGGKIGELKDLGTKNPILYLHFSQGQMKLFGTIVYPKNRYLTLQFSKGGKNVTCEDYFDTMIVFSEAWWIGRKEENPEEARLELPRELSEAHDEGYDFKGGAGAPSETKQGVKKAGLKNAEQESPKTDPEDDFSDSQNNFEDFTESSLSADVVRFPLSPTGGAAEVALGATKPKPWPIDRVARPNDCFDMHNEGNQYSIMRRKRKTVHSCLLIVDHDNEDAAASTHFSGKVQPSARSVIKQKEPSRSSHSCLVQPTISSLFKKVEEKDERLSKKVNVIDDRKAGYKKVTKEQPKVEDDDIEEFSSTSKDSDGSDEDWAG